jgi:membrane protease YdiL (CAAX protease family)
MLIRIGQATGLQIAFLMFAVMLVAVPITNFVTREASLTGIPQALVEHGMHFGLAILLIGLVPPLRRFASRALGVPIPASMRVEVAVLSLGKLSHAFATAAALAAWSYLVSGPTGVEGLASNPDRDHAYAASEPGIVRLLLSILVAPVIEELVFRGFIYRAFERQWGWILSMLATSILFGLYHIHFWSAFLASVIFVCLLRRTGSLRAPIYVHAVFNLMMWWPLLGRYIFPGSSDISTPSTWYFHGACLGLMIIWLPIYIWMSRDRPVVIPPTQFLEPNVPLQK